MGKKGSAYNGWKGEEAEEKGRMKGIKRFSREQVGRHNSRESCWIVICDYVYDVTEFLPEHPGGEDVILKYAGRDATEEYQLVHSEDTAKRYLAKEKQMGVVESDSGQQSEAGSLLKKPESTTREKSEEKNPGIPALSNFISLMDFESVAQKLMRRSAWAYYSSGSDDEITLRENRQAYQRIWFKPRVLQNVQYIDMRTTMLGSPTSAPFYITATALAKLGCAEGEICLTKAAQSQNIIQMIPTLSSCSLADICTATGPDQPVWLQLYVNQDRGVTERIIREAEHGGCRGLFITVDAPQLGKREKDMRVRYEEDLAEVQRSGEMGSAGRNQGASRAISSFIDASLSWNDIPWFFSITKLPIFLKGVQRLDDIIHAYQLGLHGVVISNHGGRQLDTARSSVEVLGRVGPRLAELGIVGGIQRGCGRRFEVLIDGGVRRGSDVVKALCLGATGVGIGRPFLYAMSVHGQSGVEKAIQILKDEIEMTMRLLGVQSISQLTPDLIDTHGLLAGHVGSGPRDLLAESVYQPVTPVNLNHRLPSKL